MFFYNGFLFGCMLVLISAIKDSSSDVDQSNEIACSTVKCSEDTVCQVVQDRAQCVSKIITGTDSFCHLPAETGRCRGHIESYYYNSTTSSCEKFIYGGCKGNKNRFQTIDQCEKACKTSDNSSNEFEAKSDTKFKVGECPVIEQDGSNSESCEHLCSNDEECPNEKKCCSNGCGYICSQPTLKETDTKQIAKDVCRLKLDVGRCKDFVSRWHYVDGECKEFSFGGCEGNENNFETKEDCHQNCAGVSSCISTENISPPYGCDVVYYTKLDGCQGFQFKCKGGACAENPCKKECELCVNIPVQCVTPPCAEFTCAQNETCLRSAAKDIFFVETTNVKISQENIETSGDNQPNIETQRICHLKSETGRCRGFLKRWYYTGDACEEFTYGGCKGNENNFESKEDCDRRCSGVLPCPVDEAGKAPAGCQWSYIRMPNGCQESFLNCTEGPCADKPCKNECEYCINEQKQCLVSPCPQYICSKNTSCQAQPNLALDSVNEICQLPPVTGKCRGAFTRWYYNETSAKCDTFLFGGCGGNENRFDNEELCSQTCKKETPKDITDPSSKLRKCHLPAFAGPCTTFTNRWYYDGNTCTEFIYGGCEGNDNNFATSEECEKGCSDVPACPPLVVPQPILQGCILLPQTKSDGCQTLTVTCPAAACANNPCKGQCEICVNEEKHCVQAPCPQYKCEKNQTCLDSNNDQKLNEICQLPPKVGNCRAALTKWFFNTTSEECEKFLYGGCKGNENRFETVEECKSTCNTDSKKIIQVKKFNDATKYEVCRLPSQSGDCKDSMKRWVYEIGECREFSYTGCGGNSNNFKTQDECWSLCTGVKPCPVFDAPEPIEGCQIVTYLTDDQCAKFHYRCTKGACATKPCSSDCENCINEPKLCKQPPCPQYRCERNETCVSDLCSSLKCQTGYTCDSLNGTATCVKRAMEMSCNSKLGIGTCRGRYESYYYDIVTATCKSFTYSGCEGNANRFGSVKKCQEICHS